MHATRCLKTYHLEVCIVFWLNFDLRFDYILTIQKFKGGGSSGEEIANIPSRRKDMPCYIHSFAMTSKYIIIIEQPLFIDKTATNGINLHHHLKWKGHLPVSQHFQIGTTHLVISCISMIRNLEFKISRLLLNKHQIRRKNES